MEEGSSLCGDVTWMDLDSLAFILHLFNHFGIVPRLVCSFCEAMPGSMLMHSTAELSANVVAVDSFEVGRSVVYCRYNNGHRTLHLGTPALTKESSVYSVSIFKKKYLQCR
jgi:hypothetical protein